MPKIAITLPADWQDAFQQAADAAGVSLSRWMAEQCRRGVESRKRRSLTPWRDRGRPKTRGDK